MSWLSNRLHRRRIVDQRRADDRQAAGIAEVDLQQFIVTRRGVEGYAEAPTTFNRASLLLVAHDGEWTRRTVPSLSWGHDFCRRYGVPCYDAGVVGYPQRMRDYNARQRRR